MINTKALLEPMGSWAWWRSWIQLFVGCAIMGSGFVFFINPYNFVPGGVYGCLLYTSPSPRDKRQSRMPSSA